MFQKHKKFNKNEITIATIDEIFGDTVQVPATNTPHQPQQRNSSIVYELFIKTQYYNDIISGRKTVEVRIAKGQFTNIKPGDKIKFVCGPRSTIKTVSHATSYTSYGKLLLKEGIKNCLPDAPHLMAAIEIYNLLAPKTKEETVIAFGLTI